MLLRRVHQFIEKHQLIAPGARVLVGVSGGVDSVVLLHLLKKLDFAPVAAHVNYRLRGEASDGDDAFVRALCERLGVPVHVEAFDTAAYADERGQSIQEAARDLRYDFFARRAEAEGLRYVAVAHQRDDQAETVLLHLLRGAGPEGLAGMPVQRSLTPGGDVLLVRPLLGERRAEIEAYARAEGLSWREDESNQSLMYRRNVLREVVLPLLEEHFGEAATDNIARSAGLVREYVEDAFGRELAAHFEQAAQPEERRLDLGVLRALAPVWRRRLVLEGLKSWLPEVQRHAALAEEIEALIEAQPGRRVVLKGGIVWRERTSLLFERPAEAAAQAEDEVFIHPGETLELGPGVLCVELLDEPPARLDAGAPQAVVVDADVLSFPLVARRWQPGDRFRPLGMTGTKKVSDVLTDAKVPPHRRAGTMVLVSGDQIVWVVGLRLAHEARVRPETKRLAKFTYIQRV
ncbi:MAG: tRNA lysidine(34) synthetase TilS [Bacteroidetes bacterium]|nr:tRNA lysidine(34) synthetase TilS [Bacteroidota bacterium]